MKSKIVTRAFFNLSSSFFILYSLFFFLSSCSTQPYVVESGNDTTDSVEVAIFVVNHGWHTGIIVPAAPFQEELPALHKRFGDAVYLEFGWGDKGFYQAEEITFGLTMKALFWPTKTVVHVVPLSEDIKSYFSNVKTLCLSKSALSALTTFLVNSFARNRDGEIIQAAKGLYGNGQFYQGSGSYHLFNTCNKWTAKGLQSAGYDISPSLKLTAESIMKFVALEQDSTQQCGQ